MILENSALLKNEKVNYKYNVNFAIILLVILFSFLSALIIFFDFDKPYYYSSLPLLPMVFCLLNLLILPIYKNLFSNIGLTLIVGLMFFRLAICPLLMTLGDYNTVITLNISENTTKAVFLMIYEAIMIYGVFILFFLKQDKKSPFLHFKATKNEISKINISFSFKIILIILSIVFLVILLIVPGLKNLYRTIFRLGDKYYTHLTATAIINEFGTTFFKKGALIIGIYVFRILRLLVPATILVMIKNTRKKISLPLSILVILTQFLVVDDTIARSFYNAFVLFLLLTFLYPKKANKLIIYSFLFAAVSVAIYFIIRYNTTKDNTNFFNYLSLIANNYFSGVNITSGIFNLPRNYELRWHYFIYDYLEAIPFGNTIFGFQGEVIQTFFNKYNAVFGQIPTTISCGYYYFGVIFAPLYSILLTFFTLISGEKVLKTENLLVKVIWIYISLNMAMGIVMYNFSITLIGFTYVIIPILLIKRTLKQEY